MTIPDNSRINTAVLLCAAVFVCGCAPRTPLERAVRGADETSWELAAPGLLGRLADPDVTILVESFGEPDEIGMMTAYATPRVRASRSKVAPYIHPIHAAPEGGTSLTRRNLLEEGRLDGLELAWLDDALEAYLVQVNGSAVLDWVDPASGSPTGQETAIVWSESNGHSYASLGRMAIEDGLAGEDAMSLDLLRALHEEAPERIGMLMLRNPRYIMFRALPPGGSINGSRGVPLVQGVSLAADPCHETGAILLVEPIDGSPPLIGLVHDGGAAIVGSQRIDTYLGVGPEAMDAAGRVVVPARVSRVRVEDVD